MEKNNATHTISPYDATIYRYGRITTIIFLIILICVPLSMQIIWQVDVDFFTTLKAFVTPFALFLIVSIVEVFTLAPLLGPGGTFMSFNSGNTTNITMPAAVSAMKVSGYEAGSREAEVVSLVGISSSVITSKIIIFVSWLGINMIIPLLESPALKPAFENFLPALLGALIFPVLKKDPKTAALPFVVVVIATLLLGYSTFEGIEPFIMPIIVVLAVLWKRYLYNKGIKKKQAQATE